MKTVILWTCFYCDQYIRFLKDETSCLEIPSLYDLKKELFISKSSIATHILDSMIGRFCHSPEKIVNLLLLELI